MAYSSKKTVETFFQLVADGWEPTAIEVMNKFYPINPLKPMDSIRRKHLTQLLIKRVRTRLMVEEGLYFYSVKGKFKVLQSFDDKQDVTGRLWRLTDGFTKATIGLVDSTMEEHPQLMSNKFWVNIKARLDTIGDLALLITSQIEEQILLGAGDAKNKDEDKHK